MRSAIAMRLWCWEDGDEYKWVTRTRDQRAMDERRQRPRGHGEDDKP